MKRQNYPEINAYEKDKGIEIEKTWLDYLALHTINYNKKIKTMLCAWENTIFNFG